MQIEFGLSHHGVDRTAPVEDRPSPVVEKNSERRIHLLHGMDHIAELTGENPLHPFVGLIGFVLHVVVEGAQQIVPNRTGIEVFVLISSSPVQSAVPVKRKIPPLDIRSGLRTDIPYFPGCFFPLFVQKQGAVRKKRHIVAFRIKFLMDLLRQGRYGKGARTFSGDQKFVCLLE